MAAMVSVVAGANANRNGLISMFQVASQPALLICDVVTIALRVAEAGAARS
jgi:hypothetical protein